MNWTTGCACWNKGGSGTACKRTCLQADLAGFATEYEDRILPSDRAAAEWAAQFRVQSQRSGRTLELDDDLIAGTTKAHGLCVATCNVADFQHVDIDATNPWAAHTLPVRDHG